MKLGFFDNVKGFISKPTETFRAVPEDTLGDALKYAVIWYTIFGAITGLIMAVMFRVTSNVISSEFDIPDWITSLGFLLIPILAILSCIFAIIYILVWGAWQHLCVLICGSGKGYTQTVKASAYGNTPSYLFGWIPYIGGLIGFIGSLIVTIIGLRELHGISTGRAIAAWTLSMVLPFTLVIILMVIMAERFST